MPKLMKRRKDTRRIYFASLDSFLLCHWNHLGFVIVRLPERLSVQPAEQPDQQDDWNRNANQPK
jgi:hypothetical protein